MGGLGGESRQTVNWTEDIGAVALELREHHLSEDPEEQVVRKGTR